MSQKVLKFGDWMDSRFLVDALTVTSKFHSLEGMIALFGFQGLTFEDVGARNFYANRLYHDGVTIYYNGIHDNMGVCVELSGQGCRIFESYGTGDYEAIFDYIREEPEGFTVSRIDIAFDDLDGLLDIQRLADDTRNEEFVSKFKKSIVEYGVPKETEGITIYLGSKKSNFFIRIYDKAKERGFTDGRHWVRVELQLRHDHAAGAVKSKLPLRECLLGVLREYVRYVDEDDFDSNKWRWPTKPYWTKFLDGVAAVRLFDKPGVEYNLGNLQEFVIRQAGNAIDTYIKICGEKGLLDALKDRGTVPNKKYLALIDQYRVIQKETAAAGILAAAERE